MILYIFRASSKSEQEKEANIILKAMQLRDDPTNKRKAITITYLNTSAKPLTSLYVGIYIEGSSSGEGYEVTGVHKGISTPRPLGLGDGQFLYKVKDLKPGQKEWIEVYLNKHTTDTLKIRGYLVKDDKGYVTIGESTIIELW